MGQGCSGALKKEEEDAAFFENLVDKLKAPPPKRKPAKPKAPPRGARLAKNSTPVKTAAAVPADPSSTSNFFGAGPATSAFPARHQRRSSTPPSPPPQKAPAAKENSKPRKGKQSKSGSGSGNPKAKAKKGSRWKAGKSKKSAKSAAAAAAGSGKQRSKAKPDSSAGKGSTTPTKSAQPKSKSDSVKTAITAVKELTAKEKQPSAGGVYKCNSAYFASPYLIPSEPTAASLTEKSSPPSPPPKQDLKFSSSSSPSGLSLPGELGKTAADGVAPTFDLPDDLANQENHFPLMKPTKSGTSLASRGSLRSVGKWTAIEDEDGERATLEVNSSMRREAEAVTAMADLEEKETKLAKSGEDQASEGGGIGYCTLLKREDPDGMA